MKKFLFIIVCLLLYSNILYAAEFKIDNFKLNVYSNIYGDFFYSYNKPSNYTNDITHSFSSSAFIGSSHIGVDLNYSKINILFEAGISDIIRKYYIKYNISNEENHFILIGRDTTLAYYSFGQIAKNLAGLNDYGTLADNRRFQLRYGIKNFQIALILPYLSDWNSQYVNDSSSLYDGFINIPRIETSYNYQSKYIDLKAFAGYGIYMYERDNKYTVHSANAGIGSNFIIDDKTSMNISIFYGYNLNMTNSLSNSSTINIINNIFTVTNIHSFGIAAGFKYKYNDYLTAQAGLGYTFNYAAGYKSVDDAFSGYLNVEIVLNKYFSIIPEISLFNNMQSSTEQSEGYDFMAGVMLYLKL